MILVDTSAWIEHLRETDSEADLRIVALLDSRELAVTQPVVAEVVIGARDDDREAALRRFLARFRLLDFVNPGDFDGAVTIYRRCRAASIMPRGLVDCMIASVAIRYDVPVLSHDKDMAHIASVTELRLDEASLRP